MDTKRSTALLVATVVSCSLGLATVRPAGATPKPSPRFWSAQRCEQTLPREHPGIGQVICVGIGGSTSCRWSTDHRTRFYSQLKVFAWSRQANFSTLGMTGLEPGVVRSFTLATRPRPGFVRIVHHAGDAYERWPADFYLANVRLLGTHVNKHAFGAFIAPRAERVERLAERVGCAAA